MGGLFDRPRPGQPTKLARWQEAAFLARLEAGPRPADGVSVLHGEDIRRILEREFGAVYSLDSVYKLLHRLGYTPLRPRPRSRSGDELAAQGPLFVKQVNQAHPDKRIEVWFQDEMRFGQQSTLVRVWARKGSRPQVVKQTEYQALYIFSAVNPVTGNSAAMVLPTANTVLMNLFLAHLSEQVGSDVQVVLVLDNAGWHVSADLVVPMNLALLRLPPYAPRTR